MHNYLAVQLPFFSPVNHLVRFDLLSRAFLFLDIVTNYVTNYGDIVTFIMMFICLYMMYLLKISSLTS